MIYAFLAGIFTGTTVGIFLACLMTAASRSDQSQAADGPGKCSCL